VVAALAGPSLPLLLRKVCKPSRVMLPPFDFPNKRESIASRNPMAVEVAGCLITGNGPNRETLATQEAKLIAHTLSTVQAIILADSKTSKKYQRPIDGAMPILSMT